MGILRSSIFKACLLISLVSLSAYWFLKTDHPAPSARGDVVISGFYTPDAVLPEAPGVFIRHEPLNEVQSLAMAAENIRLLYSSTEGLHGEDINAVSGALYLPEGQPPEEGWPVLVWSHGTVGIGDICAPSYAGRGRRDRTYLNPWLEKGYAIAASDYQGLGTPGSHPYLDTRTMAYNNLDLIRALRSVPFPLSQKIVIAGQSQGASGAMATAAYAKGYADDAKFQGIIMTGIPYFSRKVIWSLRKNSDPDAVDANVALSLYMLTLTEQLNPKFNLDSIISEDAKAVVSKIGSTCVFDFIDATKKAGLSSRKTFTKSTIYKYLKAMSRMQFPTLKIDVPVFTGTGTTDKITPLNMQQAFIKDACKAGSVLNINTYEGANHNQGLLQSTEAAMAFAQAVFNGEEIDNTCP